MKVVNIEGDYDSMEVTFEAGRVVEIWGELIVDGFVAFKDSIRKWKKPEEKEISESEKQEIIEAVIEDFKNSVMNILFE